MKLIANYKLDGKPQRQLFSEGNQLYRRIVMLTDRTVLEKPIWQEQIHNGDWHNIIGPRADELEKNTVVE